MSMDQDRIEEILRESFPKDEPQGMRERVLSKAAGELHPARVSWWPKVRLAFACAAVLLVLFANLSDKARQSRIAGVPDAQPRLSTEYTVKALAERQKLAREMMAWTGRDAKIPKVGDQL